MPEPTPPPTPAPSLKGRASRSQIDKAILDELDLAENLLNTAEKDEYLPRLRAEEGIDPGFCTDLRAALKTARDFAAEAVKQTNQKQDTTGVEAGRKKTLVALLRQIQAKAKRQHAAQQPALLKTYYVGEKIDNSRAQLVQAAKSILKQLAEDTLPGVTAPKIESIDAALKAYVTVETVQSGGQGDATGARALLQTKVAAIADRRRQIQFAADAQWPPADKAHAGIRREFKLQANKAFNG